MGRSLGARIVAVIGGIVLIGLALRLVGNVLKPVIPGLLWQAFSDGWTLLYRMISPAMAAMAAAAILAAFCWVVMAWLKRH